MSHKEFGNKGDTYRRDVAERSGGSSSSRRQDNNSDSDRDRKRSRSPQTHRQQHPRRGDDDRGGGPSPRQRPFDGGPRHYRDNKNRDDNRRGGGGWRRRDDNSRGGGGQRDSTTEGNDGRPSWENSSVRRHAESIQQRKLLWGKSKNTATGGSEPNESIGASSASGAPAATSEKALESAWTSRLAAATTDSQQMSKFQRLMGMKKTNGGDGAGTTTAKDAAGGADTAESARLEQERHRQADLTAQLDRQYTAARASTHFGRGKGLGFNG